MGGKRFKKGSTKRKQAEAGGKLRNNPEDSGPTTAQVAELAVDLWKLRERIQTEAASERIIAACERTEDRLKRMGFEVDEMIGRPYNTNLKARVVDHEPEPGPLVIGQCISPAVFFRGNLVREAEIITKGSEEKQ